MITQTFDLNLIPDSAPVVVHCDQYDKGTGRLVINLYDGAIAYSPSGTATIQGVKPDGKGFDYSCTMSGNVVTANLTEQMTAVAGQVRTQIVVTESTGRTGTFVFILDVQRSALPADTDMSESDYQLIEQAIEETQQAVTDAEGYAEDAEAWAVGERGGIPVGPSDPTYQNNAEYWAYIASQYAQGGLVYKGSCLFANIPVTGMIHGDMWNIEDDFTTDSRFEEGAGIACAAGTNIAWNGSKWDVLAVAKSGVQSFNGRTGIVTPQAGDYDLTDMGDIVVTSATDGQVLKWDATSQKWVNGNASSTLSGLDDVSLSSPTNGQVLSYDSTTQKWKNTSSQGGGLLPHFYIESESGSTVTVVAPDSSVITPTQMSTDHWECDVPSYGVYVVHSVLNGDDATVSVTVDDVKEYQINDAHYSFSLSVYAPVNSTIRVGATGESYYATGMGTTPVVFALHKASTTYAITVTFEGFSKSTQITTPATSGGSQSVTIEFGTINVTYDNDFRGVSITCVQGAITITKTAPSTGNTMTFYPPTTGQWTISGTVGGTQYGTTTNITSLSTPVSVTLETIPDGSTTTPTDDIQKWLSCAGIKDKAYTTLSQVLADSETFNALLGDSNACAYMARSTTWTTDLCADQYAMNMIGQYDVCCDALLADSTWASAICNSTYFEYVLNVKVPVMTSNTTPKGVAFGSETGSQYAYKAFDGNDTTITGGASSAGNTGYTFTDKVKIYKIRFKPYSRRIKDYSIEATNDTSDVSSWVTLKGGLICPDNTSNYQEVFLDGNTEYFSYRLNSTSSWNDNYTLYELQFYGRTTSSEKIHGGYNDTFYYVNSGTDTPVSDPSLLDAGTYTIYSNGVAKNPSDLSADYGKTVRICPNTKEVVVRPDNSLYWYGYMSGGCEEVSTANGWTPYSGSTFISPTFNSTNMYCQAQSGAKGGGIGGKYELDIDTAIHAIGLATLASSHGGYVSYETSKATLETHENNLDTTLSHKTISVSGNYYVYAFSSDNNSARSITLYALWYE